MRRRSRAFKAASFELEARLLLANAPPAPASTVVVDGARSLHSKTIVAGARSVHPSVFFDDNTVPGTRQVFQVVTQQDGEATLKLLGYIAPGAGTLQVVVATDPSSAAVGVNVGAVHKTVAFENGSSEATVKVPILAGAPNPGEVDVDLTITPIDPPPDLTIAFPTERLKILASAALVPPRIVSSQGTPQGIVLTFSKPMDPGGASNLNNYAVRSTTITSKQNPFWGPFNFVTLPLHMDSPGLGFSMSSSTHAVPLVAAHYDSATNSVTLVPRHRLTYAAGITVTQAEPTRQSGGPGHRSNPGAALADLEGNPINGETTPGKFQVLVRRGTTSIP